MWIHVYRPFIEYLRENPHRTHKNDMFRKIVTFDALIGLL
jgi:hypothetical protein